MICIFFEIKYTNFKVIFILVYNLTTKKLDTWRFKSKKMHLLKCMSWNASLEMHLFKCICWNASFVMHLLQTLILQWPVCSQNRSLLQTEIRGVHIGFDTQKQQKTQNKESVARLIIENKFKTLKVKRNKQNLNRNC